MKKKPAIIAAFITTLVIGAAMLLVGMNAFYNPNAVPVSNSPTDPALSAATDPNIAAVSASTSGTSASDQVKQLQSLVAQYQQQVQQLQSQLNQATTADQQYQSLLSQLQSRGIIRIDSSGNVYISRRGGD